MAIFLKEKLDNGASFEKIQEKAAEIQSQRIDHYVSNAPMNMWMENDGTISFQVRNADGDETITRPMTSWSMAQLSTKLGMPAGYAEKCIQSNHADLAAENVNTWLTDQKPGKRKKSVDYFVREYDGSVDAVLTPNYTAFDAPQILDTIEKTLNIPDYHMVGSYVSHERLHVRMIQDKLLSIPGEDLYPGISIDSSDVGRTAFNVNFFIWKKICTNGMCIAKIGGQLYHQRHMGITVREVRQELTANLTMIPQLIVKAENIIKAAQKNVVNIADEKAFQKMVAEIRRAAAMSEDEAKDVIKLAQTHYDLSLWGIGNAMTLKAQDYELDKRIVIENAAGRIIA